MLHIRPPERADVEVADPPTTLPGSVNGYDVDVKAKEERDLSDITAYGKIDFWSS